VAALGPDAGEVGREEFRERVGRGTAPLKARLLDQATIAGVGGVHTGEVNPHRGKGKHCPRCAAEMRRATVGGRTTWWCQDEQS
jgi:formamidopyrimidine-DNA glycosylase